MATIYKIWSEKGDKVYIGSTTDIQHRWSTHLSPSNDTNSRILFEEFGKENCRIEAIDDVKEDDKLIRERYWIEFYGDRVVNSTIPGRTYKEYREANKEYISQKNKEWIKANAERLKEYDRERNKTKVHCEVCDKDYRRDTIGKHLKSKMHLSKVINISTA